MADAFGVAALDRGANVEREVLGLDQAHRDLSGMQADVHLGIDTVQVIQHGHVLVEIVSGNVPVFRHDEVQAHKVRVGGGKFEAEHNLGEYGFVRQSAENLIEIADGDVA